MCHSQHNLSLTGLTQSYCDCDEHTCACRSSKLCPLPRSSNPLYGILSLAQPDFSDKMEVIGFNELFTRVAFLTGVTLSPQAVTGIHELQREFVFVLPDITKLEVKVGRSEQHSPPKSKQVTLISRAEANYLHLKSLTSSSKERARLFPLAMRRFEESLRVCPNRYLSPYLSN